MRSHRRPFRPLPALCLLFGALLVGRHADAAGVLPTEATAEQKKEAMDHFRGGKEAMEAKNWEGAASELRASLALVESPNARLELARTLRDSGNLAEAWSEYGRAVDIATKLLVKEERYARTAEAAVAERRDLETKLALVVVTVTGAPEGATLQVGGRAVPPEQWAAPVAADPGAIDVVLADSTGRELARQTLRAAPGQKGEVAMDATPVSVPPQGKATLDASDDEKPGGADQTLSTADVADTSHSALRPSSYVAAALGLAGLATFATFGILSNAKYNDLKNACPPATGGCPPGKQDDINAGKTEQLVANVGLVVGLVGAAAGVTLFLLSMPSRSSTTTTAALILGPGSIRVEGSL